MIKKTILILTLSIIFLNNAIHASTHDSINIGEIQNTYSSILDENREIQIYLPTSYKKYPNQKYPTIYLLDGETNFHYLSGIVEKLSKPPYPSIPEMIIIGIINTDRSRDLTPTPQKINNAGENKRITGETGGNNLFFQFLENELIPMINREYRTNGFNIFIGHSFGGITALNHMINGTKKMQAYLVHDPSIWWDDEVMIQHFKSIKDADFNQKILFLTQVGESENKDHLTAHYSSIQKFNDYLNEKPFSNLNYQYRQYDNEDHGSIPMIGNLDGLRYIFSDIRVNIKEIPNNPNLVKEQYAKLSEQLGYEIQPSEPYLDSVLNYLQRSASSEIIAKFQDYIFSIYPKKEP